MDLVSIGKWPFDRPPKLTDRPVHSTPVKSIQVNGKPHPSHAASIADLLVELQLAGKPVAVERNGEVVPRRMHDQTSVLDGDVFELVTFVGGG